MEYLTKMTQPWGLPLPGWTSSPVLLLYPISKYINKIIRARYCSQCWVPGFYTKQTLNCSKIPPEELLTTQTQTLSRPSDFQTRGGDGGTYQGRLGGTYQAGLSCVGAAWRAGSQVTAAPWRAVRTACTGWVPRDLGRSDRVRWTCWAVTPTPLSWPAPTGNTQLLWCSRKSHTTTQVMTTGSRVWLNCNCIINYNVIENNNCKQVIIVL